MVTRSLASLAAELRRQSEGRVTRDPRCQCGETVPPNRWNAHVASCPALGPKDEEPPRPAA